MYCLRTYLFPSTPHNTTFLYRDILWSPKRRINPTYLFQTTNEPNDFNTDIYETGILFVVVPLSNFYLPWLSQYFFRPPSLPYLTLPLPPPTQKNEEKILRCGKTETSYTIKTFNIYLLKLFFMLWAFHSFFCCFISSKIFKFDWRILILRQKCFYSAGYRLYPAL